LPFPERKHREHAVGCSCQAANGPRRRHFLGTSDRRAAEEIANIVEGSVNRLRQQDAVMKPIEY